MNLETIIDTLSWCRTWPPNGSKGIRAKQKLLRKPKGACKSSWSLIGNQKSLTQTIPLKFGKSCRDLSWNHCTSTPHRSETNGIAERAVRRVKEGTSAVLLQSGLDEKWWSDTMECFTYMRNIQDLLSDGKTLYERRFGVHHLAARLFRGKLDANISSWSYDMEGHAKKCVERYCELANKTTQQLHKVSTPCLDDHHFKEEEIGSVGDLSEVCAQIVLKCLYSVQNGRLDILWSVNKLARAITKWTRAGDKRLARLISFIYHRKIQNQHRTESCAFSEATRSCQKVGCARNRPRSHTVQQKLNLSLLTQVYAWMEFPPSIFGTEAEITSLDAGPRIWIFGILL